MRECDECGRPCHGLLCPACAEADAQEFRVARDYLRLHPRVTVADAARETGIPERKWLRWLRRGWLKVCRTCPVCGRVTEGEVCSECASRLSGPGSRDSRPFLAEGAEKARVWVVGVRSAVESGGRIGVLKSVLRRRERS